MCSRIKGNMSVVVVLEWWDHGEFLLSLFLFSEMYLNNKFHFHNKGEERIRASSSNVKEKCATRKTKKKPLGFAEGKEWVCVGRRLSKEQFP